MNPNLSDWDDDLPPEPEEAYQDLLRALKRKSGFGLFFVQCTPVEADKFIVKLPQEIPQKNIAVLRLVESIDNLYQPVAEFLKDKQVDILLIKGLEYSLYKYEKRSFGEITEGQFSNLTSVPHILNHLNQQRERFRDDFPISLVFLVRSFSINYFIHRAPDFFDWRSGVFELPTTPEVVEQESNRLLLEGNYNKYLKLTHQQKIEKIIEIQDLLREKHQTENRKTSLLLELRNLLISTKEYEEAIASFNQALKIKADDHEAWNDRGYALFNLGRFEEAIASFDQALKIKADDHEAWNNRGIALGYLKRYEEEVASYDKAIEIKPDYQEAWYHRGIALKDLSKWKEALANWEKAIEIEPNDHSSLNWQGNALDILGQSEEAIICYDQALALNPKHPHAWYNRGIALGNLRRYEEASASCDQALKFKADDYEAWYCKGNALFNLGRFEEAIASYDQALKFKPDLHQAWKNRGNALFNLRRFEEAIASYDQALKFKSDYHYAWYYKGSSLIKLGRWREGNKSISKAFEINSDFMNALLDIQKKHIISWFQQKLGLQKLVWIWISILRLIGFRR
ncbi:MAG: tetratricopeptide repeat protein [Nostoc sp. DedQUE08]|uniref:tetratricopeptide repeat protein n=1 Tax=unclassified Nostoc TaxID=2593658 RepID=UPI002AD3CCF9|nr:MULTISPECIES: tetratricopeptide repeat protein [unclassified Nostoc]MDZ8068956.1 tetratricopeptide repeat protein [Nostoc sp. DedQUE08]MDZ8095656.1 tetratricopeptide repeat protein [Nostoc sp. DedQUE05]